jgi:hypothetical protein
MEKLLAKIIEEMFKRLSPEMRKLLTDKLTELEKMAHTTVNPWDDILVMILKTVLGMA